MIASDYYIKPISKKVANRIQEMYHYLHRKVGCSFAFGLLSQKTNELKGVIIYGPPASPTVCKGICGLEEAVNVIELNRLWISDNVPKCSETWFIAQTMKLIPFDIIISYADPSVGHVGTIYQAGNWIYTGLTTKQKIWTLKGFDGHHKGLSNKFKVSDIKNRPNFEYVNSVQKHRYVFFNCNRRRKRELFTKLKYKILPYPKLPRCDDKESDRLRCEAPLSSPP